MSHAHNRKLYWKNYYWENKYCNIHLQSINFNDDDKATLEDNEAFTGEWLNGFLCLIPVIAGWLEGVKCPPLYLNKFGASRRGILVRPNFM